MTVQPVGSLHPHDPIDLSSRAFWSTSAAEREKSSPRCARSGPSAGIRRSRTL